MRQVVIGQFTMFQQRVDMRQTGRWTIAFGNCHGAIEMNYWRRPYSHQLVVKRTICRQSVAAADSASAWTAAIAACSV